MIKKIIFISDHYRNKQERNVKILFGLISPIFLDLNIKIEILPNSAQDFDEEKWVKSLDGIGESTLVDIDLEDTAIIGFEINPIDKTFLDSRAIPWINIEIHPIRFLEDLYFSVTSSFAFDFDLLSCNENQIHFTANTLKLKNLEQKLDIKDNALIIVGQTPRDKSLYFDHEFKSLLHYIKKLEKLCESHDAIYFRPHPIETDVEVDEAIIKRFGVSILPDMNYYDLLSADQVSTICGISSSSLYEAKYFGKAVTFLEERVKIFAKPISLKSLLECSQLWFDGLLSLDDKQYKMQKFELYENLCRDLYGYWSYETQVRKASDIAFGAHIDACEAIAKADEAIIKANRIQHVLESTSWKITKPLRLLKSLVFGSK